MLGIIFLYYVWKRFSELALQYGKSKQYGWFGVLGYIGGLFLLGIVLGFLDQLLDWGIDWENSMAIRLIDIPVGLLFCYVLYVILEKKWKAEYEKLDSLDDIGKSSQVEDSNQ